MTNQPALESSAAYLEAVSRKVDRAVELNRTLATLSRELDGLKADLRSLASSGVFVPTDTGAVEIRSLETENCAVVTFPKDTPALIKGADTTILCALTQGQFDLLFRRVVVLQPTEKFEQAFATQAKKVQRIVEKVVSWNPNTPAVRLSK